MCSACEGIFSRSEATFAHQLFHPYWTESGKRFPYGGWLLHFCASVSWRVLRFYTDEGHLTGYDAEALEKIAAAEAAWRSFLLGERPHPGDFRQHLLPLDALASAGGELAPNLNRYLMRAVDMDVCRGNGSIFVYSKLGRFIILGFVHEPHSDHWRGTKVHATAGVVEPRNYVLPAPFWEYVNSKARRMAELLASVSDRQHQKIDESLRANVDKFIGSDAFAAMQADIEMFGADAFTRSASRGDK